MKKEEQRQRNNFGIIERDLDEIFYNPSSLAKDIYSSYEENKTSDKVLKCSLISLSYII